MLTDNLTTDCVNAMPYYYNFINNEEGKYIPEKVLQHISICQNCRAEINRLKDMLTHPDEHCSNKEASKNSYITGILRLHFAYMGKSVNCSTVKQFLPMLTVPSLQIKIPTPITVHVDHCQICSDDLATLKKLGLSQNRLIRFAQFLAINPFRKSISCRLAQTSAPAVLSLASDQKNPEFLIHLNACTHCRKFLYQYWESARKKLMHKEWAKNRFACRQLSQTELFDYCFPHDLDLSALPNTKSRKAVTLHLRQCPTCLDRMLHLHRTLYGIADRPNSEIITQYALQQEVNVPSEADSRDFYHDWPVNVKVVDNAKRKATGTYGLSVLPQKVKQKISASNFRRFITPSLATAALILIASAVFFTFAPTKAIAFTQVREAITKMNNAYVSLFAVGKSQPLQEEWISRSLNIKMLKNQKQCMLWDMKSKLKKTTYTYSDTVETTTVSEKTPGKTENSIINTATLKPFSQLEDLPENAVWSRVPDKSAQTEFPGTEVYDLTWTVNSVNSVSLTWFKWRFFIDPQTNLPKRIERYFRFAPEKNYTFNNYSVITHPTDEEIIATIENVFD